MRPSERKDLTEMLRKIALSAVSALVLATGAAHAAGGEVHIGDPPGQDARRR